MAKKIIAEAVRGGAPKVLRLLEVGDTAVFNIGQFKAQYIRSLACNTGLDNNVSFATKTYRDQRTIEVTRTA